MKPKTDKTNFVIDRKLWKRGASGSSALLIEPVLYEHDNVVKEDPDQGKMCCLGFYAKACGLTDKQISGLTNYASLSKMAQRKIPIAMREDEFRFINVNDGTSPHGKRREAKLIKLFAERGIKVKFVG